MDRRKDHKEREGYPNSYEEYKGSVQEENEDRAFLEFNRKHGFESKDHVRIIEGVIVIVSIAALVGCVAWVILC